MYLLLYCKYYELKYMYKMNACISILQGFLFIPITDDIRTIERLEFVLKKGCSASKLTGRFNATKYHIGKCKNVDI